MLVRIVKNWIYPDLLRQTPGGDGIWNGIRFTLEPVDECDALLVFNELSEALSVRCPSENVWAILQEPYVPYFLPWMQEGHSQFSRVYTHRPPNTSLLYRASHPLVPWHVGKSYSELVGLDLPITGKDDRISWITSTMQMLPGHRKRFAFYRFLKELCWPDLDVWGRGIRPIADKWDVMVRSRYAIAVENHYGSNYWTEKIADCWLTETLPFYYGCPNLEAFFPSEAFIRIDLDDFDSAASIIRRMVEGGEYEKRLPAIREARDLILNRYQFFPLMVKELRNNLKESSPIAVHLKPYKQSSFSRMRCHLYHMFHRLNKRRLS